MDNLNILELNKIYLKSNYIVNFLNALFHVKIKCVLFIDVCIR
jgi:hypothetical protein